MLFSCVCVCVYRQLCWLSVFPLFVQLTSLKLHLHSQEGGCDVILRAGHGGHASLAGGGGAELGGRVGGGGGGGVVGTRVLLAREGRK